ncbi:MULTISPECIES: hypothetical protein [Streptomyces]|uniref:Uncharacterized protein n=2 Tax=Streptomyces TaxID=1883 RepID=A0ABV9J216_9ACTN
MLEFYAGHSGHTVAEQRLRDDAETRYVDDILRIVVERDDAPLDRRREPDDRFVGVCWLLADAQLTDPDAAAHWTGDSDPMDVPRDRFLVAGRAWRAIREEGADPRTFGLHPPEEGPLWGERFVAGNVRLDLAALNKVETLLWDVWGADEGEFGEPLPEAVRALYDRAARVTADEVPFGAVRVLFAEEDGLRTPRTVLCPAPFNGPSRVTLR